MFRHLKLKKEMKEEKNRLMSFRIDNEELMEIYKGIWTNIEGLKNLKINALPIYDNRYIKTKNKVCTNFCGLNVPEDDRECQSFTVISINALLVCESKYYLQVYLDNCASKIINDQMTDYLDENLFEDQIL